jgi:hypothetical protein
MELPGSLGAAEAVGLEPKGSGNDPEPIPDAMAAMVEMADFLETVVPVDQAVVPPSELCAPMEFWTWYQPILPLVMLVMVGQRGRELLGLPEVPMGAVSATTFCPGRPVDWVAREAMADMVVAAQEAGILESPSSRPPDIRLTTTA